MHACVCVCVCVSVACVACSERLLLLSIHLVPGLSLRRSFLLLFCLALPCVACDAMATPAHRRGELLQLAARVWVGTPFAKGGLSVPGRCPLLGTHPRRCAVCMGCQRRGPTGHRQPLRCAHCPPPRPCGDPSQRHGVPTPGLLLLLLPLPLLFLHHRHPSRCLFCCCCCCCCFHRCCCHGSCVTPHLPLWKPAQTKGWQRLQQSRPWHACHSRPHTVATSTTASTQPSQSTQRALCCRCFAAAIPCGSPPPSPHPIHNSNNNNNPPSIQDQYR